MHALVIAAAAAPSNLPAEVWVPAMSAVFGAFIGGLIPAVFGYLTVRQQRTDSVADRNAEHHRDDAKQEADRKFDRAILARHLEAYARLCSEVWADNNDQEEPEKVRALPAFPDWPEVSWQLLGANEMMNARDISVRVDMRIKRAHAEAWYGAGTPGDERAYYSEAAARIGLEAWEIAARMRGEAGVDPFTYPFEGRFADSLKEEVAQLDRRASEKEIRRRARADAGEDDFDI
jgi:hypothetical protein